MELEIDTTKPSVARIYDYWLGGKDNFEVDRLAAEQLLKLVPDAVEMCRENRDFLRRTVTLLAGAGIRQFLDIGSGLPTQDNVHEVALRAAPDAVTVYVDNDPIVLVHGRALLAAGGNAHVIGADLREPGDIFAQAAEHLDLDRPVAVLLLSIAHFVTDDAELARVMDEIRARLAPGSYIVMSHASAGETTSDATVAAAQEVYARSAPGGITPRTRPQLAALFDGLELLEPELVPVRSWRTGLRPDYSKPNVIGIVARVP
ncbi:SAM-dependent methyltransferase [Nonomuraea sp. NPDC050310]|uniref:SAM-dependent methyltransferase n=1 Tax=Nonomuraea sp. NPDC050310 TaxID=3154935 RepID=UPI0033CEC450